MFSFIRRLFNPWRKERWWFVAYRTANSTGWVVQKASGNPEEALDKIIEGVDGQSLELVPTFVTILRP